MSAWKSMAKRKWVKINPYDENTLPENNKEGIYVWAYKEV